MLYSFCHTCAILAIMTDVLIVFTVCPGNANCYLPDAYLLTAVISHCFNTNCSVETYHYVVKDAIT